MTKPCPKCGKAGVLLLFSVACDYCNPATKTYNGVAPPGIVHKPSLIAPHNPAKPIKEQIKEYCDSHPRLGKHNDYSWFTVGTLGHIFACEFRNHSNKWQLVPWSSSSKSQIFSDVREKDLNETLHTECIIPTSGPRVRWDSKQAKFMEVP